MALSLYIYVCLYAILIGWFERLFVYVCKINKSNLHEWQLYHLKEYKDGNSQNEQRKNTQCYACVRMKWVSWI